MPKIIVMFKTIYIILIINNHSRLAAPLSTVNMTTIASKTTQK